MPLHDQSGRGWHGPDAIRTNNFDFLRLALAVVVIFSHSHELLVGVAAEEPLLALTGQMSSGTVAVKCFFVISGYLICHSWMRGKGLVDFVRKRVVRIYPAFLVATMACVVVAGPLSTADPLRPFHPEELWRAVWGGLSLGGDVQGYAFPTNPYPGTMNGSTWSIPYEVRCYAGVVLLAFAGCLRRPSRLLAVFGVTLLAAFWFDFFGTELHSKVLGLLLGWPRTAAQLAPCFVAGMVFYCYRSRIPHSGVAAAIAALGLILGGAMPSGLSVALPTFGAYLLFWTAYHPQIRLHGWGAKGDFSYGTYLYAFPIQQLLIRHVPGLRDPWLLFLVATVLAVAAGWVSWHVVEKRFLQRAATKPEPVGARRTGA